MLYAIILSNDNPQVLVLIELVRNFDFLKVTKKREAKKALVKPEIDSLEKDGYGILIKCHDEIIAMSKESSRNMTRRWEVAVAKRERKQKL